jgi:hypothetical protein
MPKRIVDGDAIWTSNKLLLVATEAFRAEYANLLPLSNANGSFECSPRRVWRDVYSYNRPSVSCEMVVRILDELEAARLLFRWKHTDGHIWGFWVGIRRKGLLPGVTANKRGDYKVGEEPPPGPLSRFIAGDIHSGLDSRADFQIPNQPHGDHMGSTWGPHVNPVVGTCIGTCLGTCLGMGTCGAFAPDTNHLEDEEQPELSQEDSMAIRDRITDICENTLGASPERNGDSAWGSLNKLVSRRGGVNTVATMFQAWADQLTDPPSRPVGSFLRYLEGKPLDEVRGMVNPAAETGAGAVLDLADDLTYLSGNTAVFTAFHRTGLATLLDEGHTAVEISGAFRAFFDGIDAENTNERRFIAKNFVEAAGSLVRSTRRKKQEADKQTQLIADTAVRMRAKADREMAEMEAERAAEAELAEEEL